MIVIGTATRAPNGAYFVIAAPAQFDRFHAVRLTNYTPDAIILSDIQGTAGGSQEYLMPQQQMVYKTANVSAIPRLVAVLLGTGYGALALFVEWSDDPDNDFTGTYPTNIIQVPVSAGGGQGAGAVVPQIHTGQVFLGTASSTSAYPIPANPNRVSITIQNNSTNGAAIYILGTGYSGSGAWSPNPAPSLLPGEAITLNTNAQTWWSPSVSGTCGNECVLDWVEEAYT